MWILRTMSLPSAVGFERSCVSHAIALHQRTNQNSLGNRTNWIVFWVRTIYIQCCRLWGLREIIPSLFLPAAHFLHNDFYLEFIWFYDDEVERVAYWSWLTSATVTCVGSHTPAKVVTTLRRLPFLRPFRQLHDSFSSLVSFWTQCWPCLWVGALAPLRSIHKMVSWSSPLSLAWIPCPLLACTTEANFYYSNSFIIESMYTLSIVSIKISRACDDAVWCCQTNFHRVEVPFFAPRSIDHLSILKVLRSWSFTSLCIRIQSDSKEMMRFLSRHSFHVNKSTEHKWKEWMKTFQMASSVSRARLSLSAQQWNSDPFSCRYTIS